jgi:hypothetical protein
MAKKYPRAIIEKRRRVVVEEVIVAWEHRCAYCDRIFRSKRRDAKYCPQDSGRHCRYNAHRESKR